ncbi:MAG: hypothetical protein BroJett040_07470 [Oligoflexia bacterium]|nr:MAG: hypothetical protein BroJett040_07470 [Oligoflexia bacterium]
MLRLFILIAAIILGIQFALDAAEARDRSVDMGRKRPDRRGNERSVAVTQVQIGNPQYSGNGCPDGTMRVSFAPDYLSFTILFDQFVAELKPGSESQNPGTRPGRGGGGQGIGRGSGNNPIRGPGPGRLNLDVMTCDAMIPMAIPQGTQMEITRVDLRGFASLPEKSRGVLQTVFNFRGRTGDRDRMNLRYQFQGPVSENYFLSSDQIVNSNTEVSPCGGQFYLRIQNRLQIVSTLANQEAILTLDSIDGANNAIYFVNWRACR